MSFERVVDDLEMTMETFTSDGSGGGGGGEASDSQLDGGEKDVGDSGKDDQEDYNWLPATE
jgi:hypothetical protein